MGGLLYDRRLSHGGGVDIRGGRKCGGSINTTLADARCRSGREDPTATERGRRAEERGCFFYNERISNHISFMST